MDKRDEIECDSKPFIESNRVVDQSQGAECVPMECKEEIESSMYSDISEQISDGLNYEMKGHRFAIIINMMTFPTPEENRYGSDKDEKSIYNAFQHLQFKVKILRDKNKKELFMELEKIGAQDFTKYDSLAVVIMTHGEFDFLLSVDNERFTLREVEEYFLPGKCRTLIGKPKLFFVQACRGTEITESFKACDERPKKNDSEIVYRIPKSCDVLEFYSTEQGKLSARADGTWFIQNLAERLIKYGFQETLLNILTYVINDVVRKEADLGDKIFKQQPVLVTRLSKILRFQ